MATVTETPKSYKVVGSRPIRHDGVDKVTGKALYGADVRLQGMLHGKVLRSPHPHARIRSIDTSKAEAHPDVRAVATAADLAEVADTLAEVGEDIFTSMKYVRDNVLASDKVLYKGHAVAAIAASSPHIAEEALSLIEVTYDVLPAVTNVESAMAPDAPVLHDHIITSGLDGESPKGTNVAAHHQFKLGDVDEGFADADHIVEREFRTRTVHQGYIEPQSATAWWTADGNVTIWCSSQGHFGIRDSVSKVLGLPVSRVKVVPMEIGGGFGGKLSAYLEPVVSILSRKCGAPVTTTMSRSEVLEATGPTCGGLVRMKIGASRAMGASPLPRDTWPSRRAPTQALRSWEPPPACSPPTTSRTFCSTATTSSTTSQRRAHTGRLGRLSAHSASSRYSTRSQRCWT